MTDFLRGILDKKDITIVFTKTKLFIKYHRNCYMFWAPCLNHSKNLKMQVDFNAGKIELVLLDRSNNTGAIDVKMNGSVLEEKSSFKMLGLTFSPTLDWGSYIISIVKTASKKIGALIRPMKFYSLEVALHLYKSNIQSCMEYCCHV